MVNLLTETKNWLKKLNKTPNDIIFIGSRTTGHSCTWSEFETLADKEYDPDYGSQEVAHDLEIVFSDGSWLERGEYDGSEWWEVRREFVMPFETSAITNLFVHNGSLAQANE